LGVYPSPGSAETVGGVLQPQRAGLGIVFLGQPGAVVAPHARAFLALRRLPGGDVDRARAPAVFDHEGGRRPAVERRDEIAGVAAERDADTAFLAERQIVALADVVEAVKLHHD